MNTCVPQVVTVGKQAWTELAASGEFAKTGKTVVEPLGLVVSLSII